MQEQAAAALAALPHGSTLVAVPLPSGDIALYPVMPGEFQVVEDPDGADGAADGDGGIDDSDEVSRVS